MPVGYQTKAILFSEARGLREINTPLTSHSIKQHETVEYLVHQLDFNLSGEAMTSKVLKKINSKLKFRYCQNGYLTPAYKRPNFDYGCSSWFPFLKKNVKLKF